MKRAHKQQRKANPRPNMTPLRRAAVRVSRAEALERRVLLSSVGLVAAYGFEEGAGAIAGDASGNSNTGALNGAAWTINGKFGNALSFNGTTNWVTVPDAASLDLTTGMTLEAWVNPTTLSSYREVIIKESTGVECYNLYANSDANVPQTFANIGSGVPGAQGTTQLPTNTWTHLAATFDGTTLTLFVGGNQVSSVAAAGPLVTSTGPLRIGGNSIWGEYFSGRIDEVRVYNRALLQSEIQSDMNTAVGAAAGDTVAPTVTALTPKNGTTGVATNVNLTSTFSEAMDPATINGTTFQLRDPNGALVSAVVTYSAATGVATLNPNSNLTSFANAYYTAVVHGGAAGVKDVSGNPLAADVTWAFTTGAPTFQDNVVFSGLSEPANFCFASDGRVFVAEKSGLIKVFDNLSDTTPTIFADLNVQVHNFWDRGLLGMALAPNFPTDPHVYVLYTCDALIGGTPPRYGTPGVYSDPGPNATTTGALASARLSRLTANGNVMVPGSEQVLINDWFQQFPSHSIGTIEFGPDGMLYAGAGDAASFDFVDYGQVNNPNNDPTNEGGALRAQDLRSSGDPVSLDGSIIRIDPLTGQPVVSMTVSSPTTDANGVKSYTVTSPYLGNVPTTVRVLTPTNPAAVPHRTLYVLPVQPGVTNTSSQYSDGLEELRILNVANQYNATIIAPSFNIAPWYGDNPFDPSRRLESFIVRDLVPWVNKIEPSAATHERWLIGFSKSGNGSLDLILRHPNLFSAAAIWDSPAQLTSIAADPDMTAIFGTEANFDTYEIPALITTNGSQFKTANRLWISGDNAIFTTQMQQLHTQLQNAGILHTWVTGATRAHSWASGWLSGAVAGLAGTNTVLGNADLNEQRIIAEGMRNPFRFTFRPNTSEIWVGDVGWNAWEEINRIVAPTAPQVTNFGWPAYEGNGRQDGYDAANLPLIENLYNDPAAVTFPFYTYGHGQAVAPGEPVPTGGSAITGLAFYTTGAYPTAYNGALFFTDYSRNTLYVMFKGPNGDPDPSNIALLPFSPGAVQLRIGPGGDLFYTDLNSSTIHRIQYFGANRPPTAVISANPTSGLSPLTVNFSGTGSSDPDPGDIITYAWDLDNDGQYDDSTSATPSYTFTTGGNKTVRLQVTDNHAASSTASIVISVDNTPPTAFIDQPLSSFTYFAGQTINFVGHATDNQDGTLPASAFTWSIIIHHNTHTHHQEDIVGVTSGSFITQDHDYPSYLELDLTVTDSGGLQNTTSVILQPQIVNLTFNSVPSGLQIAVGSLTSVTPFTRTVIVNSVNTISAVTPQTVNGTTYSFLNWSDFGAATHFITAPAAPATYTVTYTTGPVPVAAYGFDEAGGASVFDATGHGNTGTITGATRTASGKNGGALSFNGTSNFVTVPDSSWLDLTNAMTLEAWVNRTTATGYRDVIIKEDVSFESYNLYANSDAARPQTWSDINGNVVGATGSAALATNAWVHLAATYDGTTLTLYVNGAAVGSTAVAGAITPSAGPLRIGGNGIWGEYFGGLIDDVRIYDQALTASQIVADMNTAVSGNRAPTAIITSDKTSGNVPLTVNFSGTSSSDPDAGDTITYAWDLDNNGLFNDSTSPTPQYTFTTGGSKTVRLQVTDNHGAVSNIATTVITVTDPNNTPPTMFIDTPSSSPPWKVGDVISFSGHATDTQDPSIPATSINWQMILHQGASTQVLQSYTGVSGGNFAIPNETYPAYLELKGTATDSGGLQGTTSLQLNPQIVILNFATSPTGLQLTVNGTIVTAPFSQTVIVNSSNPVVALASQSLSGTNYFFSIWSDGGSASHSIIAPASTATYTATYIAQPNPVASYNFNAGSGTVLADISGNGNNGTISGATWTTSGKNGGALSFTADNQIVTIPDSASLDLTTGMTLEAWIYATANSGSRNVLMKEGSGVGVYSLYQRDSANRPVGRIRVNGASYSAQGPSALTRNAWVHVAATYDGSNVMLFVNGVQVSSTAISGAITTSTGALRIGGNTIASQWFRGRVDDLRIYNVALTAAQIQADMNTQVAAAATLVATAAVVDPGATSAPLQQPSQSQRQDSPVRNALFSDTRIKSLIDSIDSLS